MSWKLYPPPEDPARNILTGLLAGTLGNRPSVGLATEGNDGRGNGKVVRLDQPSLKTSRWPETTQSVKGCG